jgi:hypothetical protein
MFVEELNPLDAVPSLHMHRCKVKQVKKLNQSDVVFDVVIKPVVAAVTCSFKNSEPEELLTILLDNKVINIWEWFVFKLFEQLILKLFFLLH